MRVLKYMFAAELFSWWTATKWKYKIWPVIWLKKHYPKQIRKLSNFVNKKLTNKGLFSHICQSVTKSYKWGSERQKIYYDANNGRNLTQNHQAWSFPIPYSGLKFLRPNSTPIMVKIAYMC